LRIKGVGLGQGLDWPAV